MMESETSEEEFYEVDKIVDHKFEDRKAYYKVRWKGYSPSQDTWEPQEHLGEGCDEIITAYFEWRAVNMRNKQKKKTSGDVTPRGNTKSPKANKQLNKTTASPTPHDSGSKHSLADSSLSNSPLIRNSPADPVADLDGPDDLETLLLGRAAAGSASASPITTGDSLEEAEDYVELENLLDSLVLDFPCPHLPHYTDSKVKETEILFRRYETNTIPSENTSDARKCLAVMMDSLRDLNSSNTVEFFSQMQSCILSSSKKAYPHLQPADICLVPAILLFKEDVVLSNSSVYTPDIDRALPGNWLPLHFAAALHRFRVCQWMLEAGCWPDVRAGGEMTPLMLALTRPSDGGREPMVKLVEGLIAKGADVSFIHSKRPIVSAFRRNKSLSRIVSLLEAQQRMLNEQVLALVNNHLAQQSDSLFVKEFFIHPQVITQPSALKYNITFQFKQPGTPVVMKLYTAYYSPPSTQSATNLRLSTQGPFPLRSVSLNGQPIKPMNATHKSITLQSQLKVGDNSLQVQLIDYSEGRLTDSVILYGCVIGQQDISHQQTD